MRVPDIFDPSVPVALDNQAPGFEWMTEHWPVRATARHFTHYVHHMDVERASQPPIINVTVPGIPGHFTGTPGAGSVTYSPDPAVTGGFAVIPESLA